MVNKLNGLSIPEYIRLDGSDIKDGTPRILILDKTVLPALGALTYTDGITTFVNTTFAENLSHFSAFAAEYSLAVNNVTTELLNH